MSNLVELVKLGLHILTNTAKATNHVQRVLLLNAVTDDGVPICELVARYWSLKN